MIEMTKPLMARLAIAFLLLIVGVQSTWIVTRSPDTSRAQPDLASFRLAEDSLHEGEVVAADIVVPAGASSDSRSAALYRRDGNKWQFEYTIYLVERASSLRDFKGYARRPRPAIGGDGIRTGRSFLEVPPLTAGEYRLTMTFTWPAHHPYWGNELVLHDDLRVIS